MKIQTMWRNLCFWAILSIIPFTFISCSDSDRVEDFEGIWRESYSELYVDGVKMKTIEEPYTQYLTGELGYGAIKIDDYGYPYRDRARLYHQFYSGGVVTTYGYGEEGKSMMDANSTYDYNPQSSQLIINDNSFEIVKKNYNEFVVKEVLGKSLVGILREYDAYVWDENCYVLTHYKRVSKLGK